MKLYKLDSVGKLRLWEVIRVKNTIHVRHGQVDGAMQESEDTIRIGKGGRTVDEQIEMMISSMIKRRIERGYFYNKSDVVKKPKNSLGFHNPMLASKVNYDKIEYENCYVQRKYDGHRCLITMHNGAAIAYSRGGKKITSIAHILDEIVAADRLQEGETLDGELYIHGMALQDIGSLVRTQKNQSPELIYHCYDFISSESFIKRLGKIRKIFTRMKYSRSISTVYASDESTIVSWFKTFRNEGYEGAIVRWGENGYEDGKRTKYLMKVKEVIRAEFKVINVLSSVDGLARLICKCKGGEFAVYAHGTHVRKREVLINKEKYIGKYISVEFASYTNSKKPSQPIAIEWREKSEF